MADLLSTCFADCIANAPAHMLPKRLLVCMLIITKDPRYDAATYPTHGLTPEISLLNPPRLLISQNVAHDNGQFWKNRRQPMQSNSSYRVRCQDDPVQRYAVVYEDLDRHEGCSTAGHLGVQQQDTLMLVDVLGEPEVVKLRLAC